MLGFFVKRCFQESKDNEFSYLITWSWLRLSFVKVAADLNVFHMTPCFSVIILDNNSFFRVAKFTNDFVIPAI
jgi:hypothetical protein